MATRLLVVLSLAVLAQAQTDPPLDDLPFNAALEDLNKLISPESGAWGDVPLDEACDPNHPSNQYILQFKEQTTRLMETVCQYQWDQAVENFNFAEAKDTILDQLLKTRDLVQQDQDLLNDQGLDTTLVQYLNNLSADNITEFLNEYGNFTAQWQNVLCDQAQTFMSTLDFMTIGTTETDFISEIAFYLKDYVELVARNQPVQIADVTLPVESALWGLDRIDQQDRLPRDNAMTVPGTGAGVHVYILDTGINPDHEEFAGRMGNGFTVINDERGAGDCNGHGTHCAGTAAGATYGVARSAILHSVRVLGCTGSGTGTGVIRGMDWVAANKIDPAVASMSLGGGFWAPQNTAISRMFDAGVVVAVAAGNNNADACTKSPASAEKAFTVGSTQWNDRRSGFSNYGTCVNIFGPGTGIKSAWWNSNTASRSISGTSMACPHVAGVMAVYLGLNTNAQPQNVWDGLLGVVARDKITDHCPGCAADNNLLLQTNVPGACTSDPAVPDTDCVASAWSEWGTCTATCGPGTQTRTRTIDTPASGCGTCSEQFLLSQTRACDPVNPPCPQSEPAAHGIDMSSLQFKTLTLTPSTDTDGNAIYNRGICDAPGLDYDTATHTRITLGDDASTFLALGTGFPFFGTTKASGNLCSNGYIYFSGSCSPSTRISGHFASERIAFFNADLNPAAGGVVTITNDEHFADRKVITFEAVPLYTVFNSVTVQVELIYATGVIRITWGFIVSTTHPKVIGVSQGATRRGTATVPSYTSIAPLLVADCVPRQEPPTMSPTTMSPTLSPTSSPTTMSPTSSPTLSPTLSPTVSPTMSPTVSPTTSPTLSPTLSPTGEVTPTAPTSQAPTAEPTSAPTMSTTISPTLHPTLSPTISPTMSLSMSPTMEPTMSPTSGAIMIIEDLPNAEATPAMLFTPWSSFSRRHLLSEADSLGEAQSLFSDGEDKGATGAQSTSSNGMKTMLEGKSYTYYPTQREDTSFTAWDYRITCVLDSLDEWETDGFSSVRAWDDSSTQQFLTDTIKFGGMEVGSIYVGSNGYITIGRSDGSYSPTISRHYNRHRISGVFTDLNPSQGGEIKIKDMTDAAGSGYVLVWWNDVPKYGNNALTYDFQIKIYQSGKITVMYNSIADSRHNIAMGISTSSFPNAYSNVDFLARADGRFSCADTPSLAVAVPVTSRSPTQEFQWRSGFGRHLLAGEDDYEAELNLVGAQSDAGKDGLNLGASSATNPNGFDLTGKKLTYAPLEPVAGDPNTGYAVVCQDDIGTDLPYDTSDGHTVISLRDDDFKEVPLGKTFTFMGTAYDKVYIGSNGYLTFGSGDLSYYSHRYYHYQKPRISGMFYDLNPSGSPNGFISHHQKEDSFVVTFSNIKTYSGNYFNTFQIELFFDTVMNGTTMAQPFTIAWSDVTPSTKRVIVGASAGALYRTTYYSRFRLFDLSAEATVCPVEGGAASGELGVQSAGKPGSRLSEGGIDSLSLESAETGFCPRNVFNVTFQQTMGRTTAQPPPPAAAASDTPAAPTSAGSLVFGRAAPLLAALAGAVALLLAA